MNARKHKANDIINNLLSEISEDEMNKKKVEMLEHIKPKLIDVYIPVIINDEFWNKWENNEKPDFDLADVNTGESLESWVNKHNGYFFTKEEFNNLKSYIIKTVLQIAANEASTKEDVFYGLDEIDINKVVDKDSILNLYNYIKDNLQL